MNAQISKGIKPKRRVTVRIVGNTNPFAVKLMDLTAEEKDMIRRDIEVAAKNPVHGLTASDKGTYTGKITGDRFVYTLRIFSGHRPLSAAVHTFEPIKRSLDRTQECVTPLKRWRQRDPAKARSKRFVDSKLRLNAITNGDSPE